jgi:hypothetical protein
VTELGLVMLGVLGGLFLGWGIRAYWEATQYRRIVRAAPDPTQDAAA